MLATKELLDAVITVNEAAELANKTPMTILWHINSGKIEARRAGGRWLVSKQSVIDAYNLDKKE